MEEKVGPFWRGQGLAGRRPAREFGPSATGIERKGVNPREYSKVA